MGYEGPEQGVVRGCRIVYERTLLGASKNRAWSLRLEKVDFAVP